MPYQISSTSLSMSHLESLLHTKQTIVLSAESRHAVQHCYDFIQRRLQGSDELIYGINTGFGSLCDVRISSAQIAQLQRNLIQSHACGMGDEVPSEIVKLMLLLKIQGLSLGYSGVSVALIERLIYFYNHDILPVIFQQGSLGASGDLAPLAHLGLPLIGEGEVRVKGKKISATSVLEKHQLQPLTLQAKEGLAVLNGTEFSTAYGVWCLLKAKHLLKVANLNVALGVEGFNCRLSPFDAHLHVIRPHKGQMDTAKTILGWLEGSEICAQPKTAVQDPYSFRCVPQVHGASAMAIEHVEAVLLTELNAVTDNPSVFPDDELVLSGGNFHAQPVALVLDYLAIALSELGSISERRVFQLISGKRDLPAFLTNDPGLNSGLMIPQYTAASIASQNKQLCTPASADSIVSCNGQEDHVSMAANAATKCYRIVENVERLLAIEWMTAAQAIEFRRPAKSSKKIEQYLSDYRKLVPKLEEDRILSTDMHRTVTFVREMMV